MEDLVNPSQSFWAGKRVLLTGHTGFKGAWLFHWLQRLGATVHGFALTPETQPNLAEITGIAQGPLSTIGDIRDAGALRRVMQEFQPDIVLHLAAQALVRRSYGDPLESFSTNLMGTLQVLDAASAEESVRVALVVTTDKCYRNNEWIWPYREDEALGGHDPYSASKACTEIATAAWRASLPDMPQYGGRTSPLAIATARAGNVFGGGDWAVDRLVPDIIRAVTEGVELKIRNPQARRPWQHVLEPLCGYLLLAEQLWEGRAQEAWNFGPGSEDVQPVRYIVERLLSSVPGAKPWQLDTGQHPHEATFLALDASKAKAGLGWRPRLPLGPGLDWSFEWYDRVNRGIDPTGVMEEQIDRYMQLATR